MSNGTSYSEEIQRRLNALKQASQDFVQMVSAIDGKYDSKETEIKNLEIRIERLKEDAASIQNKANEVLQQASEEGARERNEAKHLLNEAKTERLRVQQEQVKAQQMLAEAQSMFAQAIEKQKTADSQWLIIEARRKKLEEATR